MSHRLWGDYIWFNIIISYLGAFIVTDIHEMKFYVHFVLRNSLTHNEITGPLIYNSWSQNSWPNGILVQNSNNFESFFESVCKLHSGD